MSALFRTFDKHAAPAYLVALLAAGYGIALHGRTGLDVWNVWQEFPETSHGMLVPLLVVYLIALRRRGDDPSLPVPGAAGLVLLAAAEVVRQFAGADSGLFLRSLAAAMAVAAVIVLLIGTKASARCIGPILLLLLAMPLPDRLVNAVTAPLQGMATTVAAQVLLLIGQPVSHDGNSLYLGVTPVAVTRIRASHVMEGRRSAQPNR